MIAVFFFLEANAAGEAEVVPILVKREGNAEISEEDAKKYPVIESFSELTFETSAKRKIEDVEQEV